MTDHLAWPDVDQIDRPIVTIKPDGSLVLAPGATPNEASRVLWDEIIRKFSVRTNRLERVAQAAQALVGEDTKTNRAALESALSDLHSTT